MVMRTLVVHFKMHCMQAHISELMFSCSTFGRSAEYSWLGAALVHGGAFSYDRGEDGLVGRTTTSLV